MAKLQRYIKPLPSFSALLALIIFVPIVALLYVAFFNVDANDQTFQELRQTVLSDYILNSLKIVITTLFFACLFAIGPAWWCAAYEFKGRRYLQWAMVFPLAIPAYISAYIYTDALDYAGPIQSALRQTFQWQSPSDYWFFDIRSITGASIMLALALYPYIYLLLRNAFAQQNDQLEAAARLMGASPWRIFFSIRLPLARPALAIGCTLVAMESLADFGTVHLFAISTLTTAIYDSWLVYGSLAAAAKISVLLLLFVIGLVWLERRQRRAQKHYDLKGSHKSTAKHAGPLQLIFIWSICLSIITLGFVIPVVTLVGYCLDYLSENWHSTLWLHAQHTFLLAGSAALICTVLALLFNANQRFSKGSLPSTLQNASSVGYAIPGTVLSIAILIPLAALDLSLNDLLESLNMQTVGLIFSGSSFALLFAFVIRFSAISNGSIQSAYGQIPQSLDLAARSLKSSQNTIFSKIHLPLITPAIISAGLLVFIECVKELPAALLLRPFDFETLSTYAYQFASDEQLEHGALAALLIILVSLLPIFILSRTQRMS